MASSSLYIESTNKIHPISAVFYNCAVATPTIQPETLYVSIARLWFSNVVSLYGMLRSFSRINAEQQEGFISSFRATNALLDCSSRLILYYPWE